MTAKSKSPLSSAGRSAPQSEALPPPPLSPRKGSGGIWGKPASPEPSFHALTELTLRAARLRPGGEQGAEGGIAAGGGSPRRSALPPLPLSAAAPLTDGNQWHPDAQLPSPRRVTIVPQLAPLILGPAPSDPSVEAVQSTSTCFSSSIVAESGKEHPSPFAEASTSSLSSISHLGQGADVPDRDIDLPDVFEIQVEGYAGACGNSNL